MNNKQTIIEEIEEILTKYRCGIEWLMNDEDKPSGKVLSYTDTKHDIMALIQQQREQDKAELIDKVFDWIWSGWNLDLSKIDRDKKYFLKRLNQSEGEE